MPFEMVSVPVVVETVRPLSVVAVAAPSVGVVKLGEVVPAGPPVPDEAPPSNVATPVPSPDTPVEIGRPVQLVSVPDVGVPRTGAVSVRPAIVPAVAPRLTDVEPIVTLELVSDELPIFDSVLDAPDIVLLVSVSVVARPT